MEAEEHFKNGKTSKAIELLTRSLDIIQPALGEKHSMTQSILYNLETVYLADKKYEQAQPISFRLLQAQEESEDDTNFILSIQKASKSLRMQGKIDEAIGMYSLGIDRARESKEWLLIADLLNEMGVSYYTRDNYTDYLQAEKCFQQTLNILIKNIKEKKITEGTVEICFSIKNDLVRALNNLSGVLFKLKKMRESTVIMEHAIKVSKTAEGVKEEDKGDVYTNLGEITLEKSKLKTNCVLKL